jgi:acyl-coenzyme A synthetase/AMP-(fatty) acid ligase
LDDVELRRRSVTHRCDRRPLRGKLRLSGPRRGTALSGDADVTVSGAGASFYERCMESGISPGALESLRGVGSIGSTLSPECFDWMYEQLGDVWLFAT